MFFYLKGAGQIFEDLALHLAARGHGCHLFNRRTNVGAQFAPRSSTPLPESLLLIEYVFQGKIGENNVMDRNETSCAFYVSEGLLYMEMCPTIIQYNIVKRVLFSLIICPGTFYCRVSTFTFDTWILTVSQKKTKNTCRVMFWEDRADPDPLEE